MKLCKNCGAVANFPNNICSCKSTSLLDLNITFEEYAKLSQMQKDSFIRERLFLSENEFKQIKDIWSDNRVRVDESPTSVYNSHPNTPKCPTCGSTNVEPISTTRKVGGLLTLGLASKSVGKSYRCKNCKYYW